MNQFVNIAAYKFVDVDRLRERRMELRDFCRARNLKGSILLSSEGINLFMAGQREDIDAFLELIRSQPEFADLQVKESFSDRQPFNRMLVKLKKEIITIDRNEIVPARETSPKIPAQQLKRWLDEGRPVTLLDVRNDYEVELGTFENAKAIGIDHFRKFPEAIETLPDDLKDQPIVMFCTGGIRCEKAGPVMERAGFKDIYQLDGGILKYFEECGGDHYQGECFVFDQRVALDSNLKETDTTQCFACQRPLTLKDQQSPKFVLGTSCPYCYQEPAEAMLSVLEVRKKTFERICSPLLGSVPYLNRRPVSVSQKNEGLTVQEFLTKVIPQVPIEEWKEAANDKRLLREDQPIELSDIVHAGDRIERLFPATVEPDVNTDVQFLYEDDAIVVINKPAPLQVHPAGKYNRNTLTYLLYETFQPLRLRIAHRLDANTSGVLLFSKTGAIAKRLNPQFEARSVGKKYLAQVQGYPEEDLFVSDAAISKERVDGGCHIVQEDGWPSRTEFRVLARRSNGTSLIEATPITGRTNQIRIHLWDLNLPIVGDNAYLPNRELGEKQTNSVDDPPMKLHAWKLTFRHPLTNEEMTFEAEKPSWVGDWEE